MDDAGRGRRGLRPEPTPDLLAALVDHYAISPHAAVVDLGGSSNLNLRVDDGDRQYVARVYRRSVTPARLRAIQRARKAFRDGGLPYPPVIPTREGSPWADVQGALAELEAFVASDGHMNDPAALAAGLPLLGRTHSLLAGSDAGADPTFANYLSPHNSIDATRRGTDRIRSWTPTAQERVLADAADELANRIDTAAIAALPRQLVHGDFWDNNVLFRDGSVVLIADLDYMGERARIDDLALTLYFAEVSDLATLGALVAAYDRGLVDRLSAAERAALPIAIARQPLWSFGVWIATLDDEAAARAHAATMPGAVRQGLAVLDDLERWQEALT